MVLSSALGQINGSSFDFVPHPRRYLLSQALNAYIPFTKLFHSPVT